MNLETIISITAIFIALLGFIFSLVCWKKQQKHRDLLEFAEGQIEELEELLAKSRETLDANAQKSAEQSRRIAWLETRIRQPKLIPTDEVYDDTTPDEALKANITERRHRVVTLASRGQDAKTIAATLGMLPGEVELIINLNQAARIL